MPLLALVGWVSIIFDTCLHGIGTRCSTVLILANALSHGISYRTTSQVYKTVPGQEFWQWWTHIVWPLILKQLAGWFSAALRGQIPEDAQNGIPLALILFSLVLVQYSPRDYVYKQLRSPFGTFALSFGDAIHRCVKLLSVVHLFSSDYQTWQAAAVTLLIVDGSSAFCNIEFWITRLRTGCLQYGFFTTVRKIVQFVFARCLPTLALFALLSFLSSSRSELVFRSTREEETETRMYLLNTTICAALLFYMFSCGVLHQLVRFTPFKTRREVVPEHVVKAQRNSKSGKTIGEMTTTDESGDEKQKKSERTESKDKLGGVLRHRKNRSSSVHLENIKLLYL